VLWQIRFPVPGSLFPSRIRGVTTSSNHPKPVIGLCGGIGSGKSAVAEIFASLGALVIDSDRLSHEVLAEPEVLAEVVSWCGEGVVAADGGPDRAAIGRIVFGDREARKRLESLLYPLIAARRKAIVSGGYRDPAVTAIVLDSPLLLESNLDRSCDTVVFVDCPVAERRRRVEQNRGWSPAELERREQAQLPVEEKRRRAEFVVANDGSRQDLESAVAACWSRILTTYSAR